MEDTMTDHPQAIDITSAERYAWGSASEGWHLVKRPEISVIQERVPPGDRERRHFHSTARQFFYVLRGQAVMERDGARINLGAGRGLEISPGVPHQFMNESTSDVEFLVISCPPSHGDRTNLS
jgi:mannose-6-phosphate isomerase-like protein (cupin superfamily)